MSSEVVPMKANAFDMTQRSSTQLLPLFPYVHRGAIVPCSVAFETDGSGRNIGYFVHTNSVDEIAVTLASNGPQRTGEVVVGPRSHGVGGGGSTAAFFRVGVVTQRQLEDGEQPEEVSFQCEKCNAELLHHRVNMAHDGEGPRYGALPSNLMNEQAVAQLNASAEARTCKACGHVNPEFPIAIWGWSRYVRNSRIAQRGWEAIRDLEQAGEAG
ncbi:hypothetical protein GCM10007897_17360 [Sphingobium jiangsuense]|uniref:Uncharacterized protein n=1 Tax=Sphingobium jiangsuense TaxID=870476 RepID=A0A7W6BIQ1_9SPHN|nr:hypothetical protein [Sphingobium jiangsuense]MBB3925682.1 hypothetical protein [Sphingobium jiangsuense]GLT00352.1 hypothetical protein GCM10007897_17360 [Sphingobium jiangsuense]